MDSSQLQKQVKVKTYITPAQEAKYQQEFTISNVRNCTQMAVTHLAAKLKPVTPQLELLHDMCFHFMKKKSSDVFELVQPDKEERDLAPITDLGITFQGKTPETLPPHYELLKQSVDGDVGDLQRHGTKSPLMYFRRSWDEKPITAVTLISPDIGEEPPLGFEMVRRTPGAKDANLCARMKVPSLFLCIHRGEGPPIVKMGVVHVKKEKVPVGYHQISRTPIGRTPDLDMGQTVIVYKRDYKTVIRRFAKYGNTEHEEDKLLAGCFACLIGGIYSYDRHAFLYALEAFTTLNSVKSFPKGMLADFVTLVRDALTAYVSFFKNEVYVKVLKWLSHVYTTRAQELDTTAFMSMIHLCMFLRHDDARENVAKSILTTVLQQSKSARKAGRARGGAMSGYDTAPSVTLGVETAEKDDTNQVLGKALSLGVTKKKKEKSNGKEKKKGGIEEEDDDEDNEDNEEDEDKQEQEKKNDSEKDHEKEVEKELDEDTEKEKEKSSVPISIEESMRKVVLEVAEHVYIVKSTEQQTIRFLNCKVVDQEFHDWMSQFIDTLFENHFDRFIVAGATLLAKVSAQILPTRLTPKSEAIKRRIHALKLLAFFLEEGQSFFKRDATALVILRRIIFTSFLHSAITHVPAVFKTMFKLYEIFWHSYRNFLKFEIGVLLDTGMVGLLCSSFCTPPQKVDLLDGLTQMFINKSALIDIFYNYDNDVINWPVCQHLVATIAKLTEGEYFTSNHYGLKEDRVVQGALRLLARFMELMAKYLKAPNLNIGGNLDEQEDFDKLGTDYVSANVRYSFIINEDEDIGSGSDHKEAGPNSRARTGSNITLRDLATLNPKEKTEGDAVSVSSHGDEIAAQTTNLGDTLAMGLLLDNSKSPLSAPSDVTDPTLPDINALLSPQRERLNEKSKESSNEPSPKKEETNGETKKDDDPAPAITLDDDPDKRQHVWEEHKGDVDWENIQGRESRANTWQLRYAGHKEEQKIVEEALKRARQEKLKSAVKFLMNQGGKFADLKFIAQFLYVNDTLDKAEVGDFISNLDSSALNQTQHRDLLLVYVGLLNFTGMVFDAAFRHFLTDCGFRLPLEAQKIDRLIEGFAHAFTRDNPQVFVSQDQCLILAYAVLMLNTDLHNPKALSANSNGPMTQAQFANLVRNDEGPFPPDLIRELYQSVKDNPIEIKIFDREEGGGTEDVQQIQKQFRNECSRLVQRAQAHVRELATRKHSWHKAPNVRIVRALYDVTWHQFLAAITTIMGKAKDPQTQSECLEAIKYSCATAIMLGLVKPELHAFASNLAKFVYMEENKHLKQQARHLATVTGEHLKQKWFLSLLEISGRAPQVGCEIVSRICNDMQRRVVYDTDQKTLRDIEAVLGNELYIVHPERRFVKSGLLTKQSLKGDLVVYQFYLFNDLLLYASENRGAMTVHRVLHLSLCRIADLRDGFVRNIKNAFRIVSPQKPIILIAETTQEKREWFQAVQRSIEEQTEFRARWMNENYNTLQDMHPTAQLSQFIGRTVGPKRHELKRVQAAEQNMNSKDINPDVKVEITAFQRQAPCKLCARPFKRFTRKVKCPWCQHMVCNECIRRKAKIPTNKKPLRVCDGCFGAINYYIADMNHTDVEFSTTEASILPSGKEQQGA